MVSSSGYTSPSLNKITDDDNVWMDPISPSTDTQLRVSFPTPTENLVAGADLQTFNIRLKQSPGSNSNEYPIVVLHLKETLSGTSLASDSFDVTGSAEVLKSLTWDASLLNSPDGSDVEAELIVTADDTFGDSSISVEQIEWVADVAVDIAADISVTVPKPSVTATADYTAPQPQYGADIAFSVPRPSVSATASYTQAQYGADIAASVPAPSLFAAAEFMPVSGTTGWFGPTGIIQIGTNVTVSNTSNLTVEDAVFASANLQRTGGTTLQTTNVLAWDWVDPANYPAGAEIVGVEFALYVQYDTENHSNHFMYPYHLNLAGFVSPESYNEINHRVVQDWEDSPLWEHAHIWGGKTELFGLDPNELVSDFFTWGFIKYADKNANMTIINSYGSGDITATVKLAYLKAKLWWETPNYKDMAATPSFSVTASDSSAPLQKIRDIASDLSASMTASVPRVTGNPYTVYADVNFSVIIDPPTISEGSTYIDMACWMGLSVDLDADATRIRDMYADVEFDVGSVVYVGYSNPLFSDFEISVVMDPQLHRDVEMQTDAVSTWFGVTMDVDGLVGDLALATNIPISVAMNVDGMLVNWALYADAQFSVTASPALASMTNMGSDFEMGVTMDPQLHSVINMYADFVMDGLLLNTAFIRLPVPAPEERTLYMKPKGRVMRMKPKGRNITLTRN